MSLLFLVPLISGLWSEDKQQWLDSMRLKLPLLLLPLAFAGSWQFSKKDWGLIGLIFIVIVTAGTAWSFFHYINNAAAIQEGYLRSKSIITPLANDHVRFSWLITVAILLAAWIAMYKRARIFSVILFIIILWLVFFIHLLAARTGLLSFYILLIVSAIWIAFKNISAAKAVLFLVLAFSLPIAAYFILPTFHNRVRYIVHDFDYFKQAHYLQGSNDAVRVISIKAGWNIMNEHPVTGVGFGDVLSATQQWYQQNYPGMSAADKIYPSSEWALYGAACGWIGFFVFTFAMLLPFFTPTRHKLLWWLINIIAGCSFLFDIGLEVQFGIFIYSFIILSFWKSLSGAIGGKP
jgi:O-antigen ligase